MTGQMPAKMPDFCSRRHPFHYVTALNTLMKQGVDIGRVSLLAVGLFENYKGEIHGQSPAPGAALTAETEITLEVGCLSGMDHIPYQFFYGLTGGGDRGDEWEQNARELMAPFDSAVIRQHAYANHQSRKFNFGFVDKNHIKRFLELFEFSPAEHAPGLSELMFWVSAMPLFHKWAGNSRAVATILGRLLGYPVEIAENVRTRYQLPEELRSRLGKSTHGRLGEYVLGSGFSECDSTYEVIIHRMPAGKVTGFLPGGPDRKKLEWLLSVAMPSFLDFRIRIKSPARKGSLGTDSKTCYLGYTAYV